MSWLETVPWERHVCSSRTQQTNSPLNMFLRSSTTMRLLSCKSDQHLVSVFGSLATRNHASLEINGQKNTWTDSSFFLKTSGSVMSPTPWVCLIPPDRRIMIVFALCRIPRPMSSWSASPSPPPRPLRTFARNGSPKSTTTAPVFPA